MILLSRQIRIYLNRRFGQPPDNVEVLISLREELTLSSLQRGRSLKAHLWPTRGSIMNF